MSVLPTEVSRLGEAQLQRAIALLDERFGLDALWLYGSQASALARPDSDVDLAALFRHSPDPLDLRGAQQDLAELLGRAVDLVDLEHASPILAMQVLRYGRIVADGNPRRRIAFVAGVPGRYEGLKIHRREGERLLLERVRRGRA